MQSLCSEQNFTVKKKCEKEGVREQPPSCSHNIIKQSVLLPVIQVLSRDSDHLHSAASSDEEDNDPLKLHRVLVFIL